MVFCSFVREAKALRAVISAGESSAGADSSIRAEHNELESADSENG